MAGWNPMKAIRDAINKVFAAIANTIITIFKPILDAIPKIIAIFSAPFITIFTGFITVFIIGIIDSILHYLFPRDFGEKSKDDNGNWYTNPIGGWKWLCNIGLDILFVAIYFVFIVGYFFTTRLAGIFLIFLSLSMLITISIIPFLPMIYFIYICIKNSQTIAKLSKNIIIGYVNEAIYNVRETKKFFSNNVVNILLKIVLIFSYQMFLLICDIFLSLPIIVDQISKFGIIGQILVNIIIYYPVWWFLYSLYANRNNNIDFTNTTTIDNFKKILSDINILLHYYLAWHPILSNLKSAHDATLSSLSATNKDSILIKKNLENLNNVLLESEKRASGLEIMDISYRLTKIINDAPRFDFANQILNAIDSVTGTFWFVWDWINKKSTAIIQALKSK